VTGSRTWAPAGRRGSLHAVLAAARGFLLDPPELASGPDGAQGPGAEAVVPPGLSARPPVIAVFGLAGGCGSTVVARALAAELAARDASGTAAVACESKPAGVPFATHAATRLARAVEDLPGGARPLGRLCLVRARDAASLADALRGLAPLVIDAGSALLGGVPACVADRTVIVTTPAIEPALARVAVECVSRVGPQPTVVVNRCRRADDADELSEGGVGDAVALPDSRMSAQLALSGREARGGLGRAISALVDRWEVRPERGRRARAR
jgi:hypothetical protein